MLIIKDKNNHIAFFSPYFTWKVLLMGGLKSNYVHNVQEMYYLEEL